MSTAPEINRITVSRLNVDKLQAYVVSDVHLSTSRASTFHRANFVRFLKDLNAERVESQHTILVLNGDIFDVTGSWHADCLPWDGNAARVEAVLRDVLEAILEAHSEIINELRRFLDSGGEIVYIMGNHDRLIGLYPSAQAYLREKLCSPELPGDRLHFTSRFESPELGLYVEHGQRFDPFNHTDYREQPPIGDVINILIVNRFVHKALDKLITAGYSPDLVDELEGVLRQVEYLRPLSLGPYWLKSIAAQYARHPENQGKSISINRIIDDVIRETLLDKQLTAFFARRFLMPGVLVGLVLNLLLSLPLLLPALSFLVSRLLHKTNSNDYQYRMAQGIQQKGGWHLISFGHTHIPSLIPIAEQDYFFNTGCWKPIIYLFRHAEDAFFPKKPFNRIERSGIFRVEKRLDQPSSPITFSLLTVQNGLSGLTSEAAHPVGA